MIKKKFSFASFLYTGLTIAVFIMAFWGVTYTADWAGYEKSFELDLERRDLAFGFIGRIMAYFGYYEYQSVYRAHVVLMGVLFSLFISRWQKNPFFISVVFIILYYVALANQIRFYVAFPLALLCLKEIICNKNWFRFVVFAILAFVFHSSSLFFILIVFAFYVFVAKRNHVLSDVVIINIFFGLIAFFGLKYIIPFLGEFSIYLTADNQISSLIGGFYSAIPSMIAIGFVLYLHYRLRRSNSLLLINNDYNYLFVLSIATSVLLFVSFKTQIVQHRFINPLFIVWLLYYLYVAKSCKYLKQTAWISIVVVILISFAWHTFVPYYLGISKTLIDPELLLTIESIEF